MSDAKSVNVWLGSEIGILKAVNLVGKTATNYFDQRRIGKENEIVSTCWSKYRKSILCGYKHGIIRYFNLDTGQFSDVISIPDFCKGNENLVKVLSKDETLLSCTSKGHVTLWDTKLDDQRVLLKSDVGPDIFDLALSADCTRFASGGKENALKVFDVENFAEPMFKAKNVPHDWLQLRVPIWVTGIKFLTDSNSKIVTSTGTNKIRLYDISSERKRPCIEMSFDEHPLTCITLTSNTNQVIVGNTRGNIGMFDFRKKALVRVFKGLAGSVRCLETHSKLNYVASCGLDRFLRIHNVKSGKLEYKVYLKARLNTVLFSNLDFVAEQKKIEATEDETNRKRKLDDTDDEQDEDDPIWRRMKLVDESGDSSGSDE